MRSRGRIPARLLLPVTQRHAEASLAALREARPDLFAGAPPEGYRRGIDAYPEPSLTTAWRIGCNVFHKALGRLPDPDARPTTADGFFAMKFFTPMPVSPNPADKLEAAAYLPDGLRGRVGLPRRVWVSREPRLPADEAVAPGLYWLKTSQGSAMQRRIRWPVDAELRAELEALAARWLRVGYGIYWGEWWYGLTPPRIFLEEDLSHLMGSEPEIKVFVRRGRAVLLYGIRLRPDHRNEQGFFERDLTPLEGRSRENVPLEGDLPEGIAAMIEAAEACGRRFPLVRVDFLPTRGARPHLGELTLCHTNARRVLSPPAFDAEVKARLFD